MSLSSRALCTLADLKTELGISGSAEDTRLERLIEAATNAIERYCARTEGFHYEATRVDKLKGFGTPIMHVPKTPLLSIGSIVWDPDDADETITSTLYALDNARQGRIYREGGWQSTMAVRRFMVDTPLPGTEQSLYQVTYACGYLTPAQVDVGGVRGPATVTITRSGTTATVAHTAHGLVNYNQVTISEVVETAYNGLKTITVVDDDSYTYTVTSSPATPATGTITATVERTLPYDLEDACLQLAAMRYKWAPRDPSVKSEKLLSWAASYDTSVAGGIIAGGLASILDGYKRLVFA